MHNNVGRNDSVPVPSIGLKRSVFSHALSPYTIVMNNNKKKNVPRSQEKDKPHLA